MCVKTVTFVFYKRNVNIPFSFECVVLIKFTFSNCTIAVSWNAFMQLSVATFSSLTGRLEGKMSA